MVKILFISKHVVHDKLAMAGNQLFNYYLTRFCNDSNFEVGYIVAHKNDASFESMEFQYSKKAKNFSIFIPLFPRIFTYFYYNSVIRLIFSLIRPQWYLLDPIYSFFYKSAIRRLSKLNWVPNVIVFEWTEMIFLSEYVKKLFKQSYTIATEHDVSFIKVGRRYRNNFILRKLFLNRFKEVELKNLSNMNLVTVLSCQDKVRLNDSGIMNDKIFLLSPFYQNYCSDKKELKRIVVYYGAMNRMENQEAVEWFIDSVFVPYKLFELVSFIIIGAGASEKIINKYSEFKNILFAGYVESPLNYFRDSLCMVVPLLNGGGIKIKVLEAMSASVTVLTNDIGIEGIEACDGKEYFHCSEASDYNEVIRKLLKNKPLAYNVGKAGCALVNENYDFEKSFKDYKNYVGGFLGNGNIS